MFFYKLAEDIRTVKDRDPAARHGLEIYFCYPGFHAVRRHRLAHWLFTHHFRLLGRMYATFNRFLTGVDIHPGARIGRRLFIDHASGVVIGETSEIGDDVTIYQGATLGGTGKDTGKRHPTIGDGVVISAGAKILGPITIGDYCRIGAGAVVLKDAPPHCTVVGVPGRIVRRRGPDGEVIELEKEKPQITLDQINLPDPVADEIKNLHQRIESLEDMVVKLTVRKGVNDETI